MGGECDPKIRGNCERALNAAFSDLRRLEPPGSYPSRAEVERQCHARFISTLDPRIASLSIRGTYPNHPSEICRHGKGIQAIDFSNVAGSVVLMGSVSMFGNGDDDKWFSSIFGHHMSDAGMVYVSLVPLDASSMTEAQRLCPDYSPLRSVTTKFYRDGPWSDALERVGEITKTVVVGRNQSLPTPEEMKFPYRDRSSRYWGACNEGGAEVETKVVGSMPTHVPSERENDPGATKQCELGAYWQGMNYERRPMVAFDGSRQGFPRDTKFFCVRALESDPTPLLQVAISVDRLRSNDNVLLRHDAMNPKNVMSIYGCSRAQEYDAWQNSLYSITLLWKE